MKKIMCATDHSELAQKAEVFAANWAKDLGAELIYAFVSQIMDAGISVVRRGSSMTILKETALQEHEVLNHPKEVAAEAGIPEPQCVLLRSRKVAFALIEYANKNGVDHIVIGSTDRAGIPNLGLGSVAAKVVKAASCAVTVVR